MTKISANSMRFASVNGCAHTAVVYLADNSPTTVEDGYEAPIDAQSGTTSGSTPNTSIKSE